MLEVGFHAESTPRHARPRRLLCFVLAEVELRWTALKPGLGLHRLRLVPLHRQLLAQVYGVVYMFNEEYKNISMNILDCIAKCFVGLGLWAYFSKIIVL